MKSFNRAVSRKRTGMRVASAMAALCVLLTGGPALADEAAGVPTNWRMQDYTGGKIDLWYTGSTCGNGHLVLLASAPEGSKDRLWSLVLSAKLAHHSIGIFYHVENNDCVIDSFYLQAPN